MSDKEQKQEETRNMIRNKCMSAGHYSHEFIEGAFFGFGLMADIASDMMKDLRKKLYI